MKVDSLLKDIYALCEEAEDVRRKKEANGDSFNVFNIIGLKTEEVRLHSALIAELLNPHGSHGLSNSCLKSFLKMLDLPSDYFDSTKISKDYKERYIGPVTKSEGGRIDIIIEDGNHALIIENKIYAEDQENQMLRYYNYARKRFPKGYKLVYLTLDGCEPDECSFGGKDFEIDYLSYKNEIVDWLNECIDIAIRKKKSLIKNVLIQYQDLIKQLTNTDMDTKYSKQLLNTMLAPENAIAVGEMLSIQSDWLSEIIRLYIFEPLKIFAIENGMSSDVDMDYGEGGFWMYKKEWKYYGLYVWTDRKNDWCNMYVGVSNFDTPKRNEKILKRDFQKMDCLENVPCDEWPYGWEYLPEDIRNWDYGITREIVEGKVAGYLKEKFNEMLQEIEEKNLEMP